jgi:hypothetical protein
MRIYNLRKNNNITSFREWIGIKRKLDYDRVPWLGNITGVIIALITISVAVGGIATIIQFLSVVLRLDADHDAIRNIGLILVAVLGAPFFVWRATVAQKQADTAEQSHITDQINKAVAGLGADKVASKIGRPVKIFIGKSTEVTHIVKNPEVFALKPKSLELRRYHDDSIAGPGEVFSGLHIDVRTWENERTEIEWQGCSLTVEEGASIAQIGDWSVFSESLPNIEVRVGAIYALERISQDSSRDHIQIMEILTAYIRENAPARDLEPSDEPFYPARPRTDVHAALDIIGRRTPALVALEHSYKYRLDLRDVDLSGANFSRGNFEGALFYKSRLEAVNFQFSNLRGARLNTCLLNFANFFMADLSGAILDGAKINRMEGFGTSITSAAHMRGISLAGSDISALSFLPAKDTHSPTFGTIDTKLHEYLLEGYEKLANDIDQFNYHSHGGLIGDEEGVIERLKIGGFLYWSPFVSDDLTTGQLRTKLWKDIGFNGFPYED